MEIAADLAGRVDQLAATRSGPRRHGSVAAVVVFLVWVYVQAVILLYGAELTAAYARLSRASAGPPGRTPAS